MVLRRCRQLLNEEEKAYDVTQEVFLRLLKNPKILNLEYPSSFLYRIATNLSLNRIRDDKRKRETGYDLLESIASYPETEKNLVVSDLLDKIFGKEKASTRTLAVMYYVDGFTLTELSEECGMSVSGIKSGLKNLKKP